MKNPTLSIISVCQKCIFPFEYEGEIYNDCAPMENLKICAFEINPNGEMVSGRYKICPHKGCNGTFDNTTNLTSTSTTLAPITNSSSTSGKDDSDFLR